MNKKESILRTATHLFSAQGFEATTTLQIATEVGVTEPAVFYHFKNKNTLFTSILQDAGSHYLERLDAAAAAEGTAFERLKALIRMHFAVVAERPEGMRILMQTCPARLEDPENTCAKIYGQARAKLKASIKSILEAGTATGEFVGVKVDATANVLIALLNGLMRQQLAGMDALGGVEEAAIGLSGNALLRKKQ